VLANHPEIMAAQAKVALAQAELHGKRIDVSRQVLELYGNLRGLDAQIEAAKAAMVQSQSELERATAGAATGVVDQSTKQRLMAELQAAEANLVLMVGQKAQAENALQLLVGAAAEVEAPVQAVVSRRQQPQGPIVEKMAVAAEKPMQVDFIEVPLGQVLAFLSDEAGVMFSAHIPALEMVAESPDQEITLQTGEVRLLDVLQAFEDRYPSLQFVLRDYGVLVTERGYAEEHDYQPVLDMGQTAAGARQ
jgi:hypothetical protein